MNRFTRFVTTAVVCLLLSLSFWGCEEQPEDYYFEPDSRDVTNYADAVFLMIDVLYNDMDEATNYLEQASLTEDYGSLFIGGWESFPMVDTVTSETYTMYYKNYQQRDHYFLRFDRDPQPDAVRQPSSIDYTFTEVQSYQNPRTSEFYGQNSGSSQCLIEYSDNRQDYRNVEGWFLSHIRLPVIETAEVAGGFEYSYTTYLDLVWNVNIEEYSMDPNDQSCKMSFTGVFPIRDERNVYHQTQGSGEIIINAEGKGRGTVSLYGDPIANLYFENRTHRFNGWFTLDMFDHSFRINRAQ